jgi:hypothetical protein
MKEVFSREAIVNKHLHRTPKLRISFYPLQYADYFTLGLRPKGKKNNFHITDYDFKCHHS